MHVYARVCVCAFVASSVAKKGSIIYSVLKTSKLGNLLALTLQTTTVSHSALTSLINLVFTMDGRTRARTHTYTHNSK